MAKISINIATGTIQKEYTRFEGGIFGAPGQNMSNNLGFNLSNTFEAKVTDKDIEKLFNDIFGWYAPKMAKYIVGSRLFIRRCKA
jgi:hypothetical protein